MIAKKDQYYRKETAGFSELGLKYMYECCYSSNNGGMQEKPLHFNIL